jgi:hypothetical protein
MHRADDFVDGQQYDQAFDLTPVAEMDVITQVPAAIGTRCGFETGIIAMKVYKRLSIFKAFAVRHIGQQQSDSPDSGHKRPWTFRESSFNQRANIREMWGYASSDSQRAVIQMPIRDIIPISGRLVSRDEAWQ